ncbi:hypothetical protein KQI86_02840 [Clostridium sp. MSJ-11]|uniref:Uncharacterized protein n=1 Tax=Clostridium mobile TaxID=2841512 RepID=A0ABS6EDH3_9CLOT|nr:hypothetical protein [Clostridium mobile]MBU5483248.1 hypothetical protein [Clostridium mobile]
MAVNISKIKLIEIDEEQLNSFEGQDLINKKVRRTSKKDNHIKVNIENCLLSTIAYEAFPIDIEEIEECEPNFILSAALFGTNKIESQFSYWEIEMKMNNVSDEQIYEHIRKTYGDSDSFTKEDFEEIKNCSSFNDNYILRYVPLNKINMLIQQLDKTDIEDECRKLAEHMNIVFDFGLKDKNLFENIIQFYNNALQHNKSVLCILYF